MRNSNAYDQFSVESIVIFLAIAFTIGSVCSAIRATTFTLAGERVVARMRKDLFANVVKQEIGFFDTTRTGELTNRLASDTVIKKYNENVKLT